MQDNSGIIIGIIVAFIIHWAVLSYIISSATQTRKSILYDEKKIRLLMLIARKLGASDEEITNHEKGL